MSKLLSFVTAVALLSACSSSSSSHGTTGGDAGSAQDASADAPGMITETGRVIDFGTRNPVPGVKISEGSATTTTDAKGVWTLQMPVGVPTRVTLSMDGYATAHLPEEIYTADNDRGDVPLPSISTFQLAEDAQTGYDATQASISIVVRTLPSCASATGATLQVNSPSGTSTAYFKGGFPSKSATAVTAGQDPAISLYNIPVGSALDLTLQHPTCTMVPFPVASGSATFTGKVDLEAGNANSALVLFLQ